MEILIQVKQLLLRPGGEGSLHAAVSRRYWAVQPASPQIPVQHLNFSVLNFDHVLKSHLSPCLSLFSPWVIFMHLICPLGQNWIYAIAFLKVGGQFSTFDTADNGTHF